MTKLFSVWAAKGDEIGSALVEGENPPTYGNGELIDGHDVLLYTIEAATAEEAMAIYHLRQGWSPFFPMGDASPCPNCGAMYYPESSGECWRCNYKN